MLESFGQDIWISQGPVVTGAAGFHYPTRMAVMRLPDRSLVIWSPIALTPDIREAIDRLGSVGFLLPPNALHHTFVGEWQNAYPAAVLLEPPRLRAKRSDLRFDAALSQNVPTAMSGQLEILMFANDIADEAVLFHSPSRTILFTDLLQNLPADWFHGWRAIVAKLDLMSNGRPEMPRKFRMALRDRRSARETARAVLDWPIENLIMAHGEPVKGDARASVARAFSWLLKNDA